MDQNIDSDAEDIRDDDFYFQNGISNEIDNYYLNESRVPGSNRYTDNHLGTKPNINDYGRILISDSGESVVKTADADDRENNKTRKMFTKYQIPSFFRFQPMDTLSEKDSDESSSTMEAVLGEETHDVVEEDVCWWQHRVLKKTKPVNKFTLPSYEMNQVEDAVLKTRNILGQGDSPWILILDGSSESELEEESMKTNNKVISQAWQREDEEIQNNIDKKNNINSQLNNQHKKGGEGKISRFFSRLRKTSPSNTQDITTENKDMSNLIISHQDNNTQTKKSKMCSIL